MRGRLLKALPRSVNIPLLSPKSSQGRLLIAEYWHEIIRRKTKWRRTRTRRRRTRTSDRCAGWRKSTWWNHYANQFIWFSYRYSRNFSQRHPKSCITEEENALATNNSYYYSYCCSYYLCWSLLISKKNSFNEFWMLSQGSSSAFLDVWAWSEILNKSIDIIRI